MKIPSHEHVSPVKEEVVDYFNPSLYLKIWEIDLEPLQPDMEITGIWHFHKEVEFLIVTEGNMGIQTKDEYYSLQNGDIVLLGSSELHRTHRTNMSPLKFIVFQVDIFRYFDQSDLPYLHGFSETTRALSELNYLLRESPKVRQEIFSLIQSIYDESQQRERGYELFIGAAIKRLLWLLVRHDTRGLLQNNDSYDIQRLRPVFDYVERNLHQKITIEDACTLLNFSYHYFIRYFRSVMGCSFIEFINHKRIKNVERLLLTQNLSITEIAHVSGIPSTAQFYKLFNRYNKCSPKEFIKNMSGKR